MTCLHSSMWNENEKIFKQLVILGADPNKADNEGDTVMEECASRPNFLEILNDSRFLAVSMSETQFKRAQNNNEANVPLN